MAIVRYLPTKGQTQASVEIVDAADLTVIFSRSKEARFRNIDHVQTVVKDTRGIGQSEII